MRLWLTMASAFVLLGCGDRVEHYTLPDQVLDFNVLFRSNCSGCHGSEGRMGAARPLNDALFLAVIGEQALKDVITNGIPGTSMPAFARANGGNLTDRQISILANQMDKRWSRPQDFTGVELPPYHAALGDAKTGEAVFRKQCARCHGEDGNGGPKAGSIVDTAFLDLVDDQLLRTTVIAGRGDLGMPDYRKHSPPLAFQEISDVVAWVASHRESPVNVSKRGSQLP